MNSQALILIAEDESDDAFLVQRAIGRTNLVNPVQVVSDGDQVIAYLNGTGKFQNREEFPLPVLILMDLKLPRRSGLDVLNWMRHQDTAVRRIPVVILTSSSQASDVNRAYDCGANSYLVKPTDFDGLINMVRAIEVYWFGMNEQPILDPQQFQSSVDHGAVSPRIIN